MPHGKGGGKKHEFKTESKELVVTSNTLEYGIYNMQAEVVSSLLLPLILSGYALILTAGHLKATLSKLLTHCVIRSTQPPILCGTGNE